MTIIARLTQLSLRADFIFYSCENWQIVMSWNSCRARYCSRKSQGQLIQWPAVFGIILTFMLCSINLLVERLCMMHFFFFFFWSVCLFIAEARAGICRPSSDALRWMWSTANGRWFNLRLSSIRRRVSSVTIVCVCYRRALSIPRHGWEVMERSQDVQLWVLQRMGWWGQGGTVRGC